MSAPTTKKCSVDGCQGRVSLKARQSTCPRCTDEIRRNGFAAPKTDPDPRASRLTFECKTPESELLPVYFAGERSRAAEDSLPEAMRPVYRALVADYRASARACLGTCVVSAEVVAELVRRGWRKADVL